MRIAQTKAQKIKSGVHFAQAFFIFIGGCLAIAVLTQDGGTGSSVAFLLALCFLSIPGLIYQVMVPMWTRAHRFANVYAYAAIDLLYTLLWFAAFIAVAVWQSSGKKSSPDDKEEKSGDGSCASFAYGSESKCETTKASVGFGVIVFLLFGVTSAMSVQNIIKYRKTGIMPNVDPTTQGLNGRLAAEDPNKDAWSTNTDDLDPHHPSNCPPTQDDDPRRTYGQLSTEDSQSHSLLHRPSLQGEDPFADSHSMTEHGMHPGRAMSYQSNTSLSITVPPSYHERPSEDEHALSPSGYVAPSALSPSDYAETPGGRINFPHSNYGADFR